MPVKPLPKAEEQTLTPEVLEEIRKLAIFRSIPEPDVAGLFEEATVQEAPRDTLLFCQGDAADRFYIVLEGRVELFVVSHPRRESAIDVIGGGETLALASIFDLGAFPISAKVVEDARLIMVPAGPFLDHLTNNFQVVLSMLASMSVHLRFLIQQISELKLKTTGQRLGSFLLGLTDAQTGRVSVRLPYDKKLLANRLGMKPESLSRALGKLREVGVSGDHDTVIIDDVEVLRSFCQEGEAAQAS